MGSATPKRARETGDSLRASAEPQAGDRISEYVLEEPIGEGGFGKVWKARHAVLPGRTVAVKFPHGRELIHALEREGLIQNRLEHPGAVRILGLDPDAEVPYLVEEYVPGRDLAALLAAEGPLAPERALAILQEVAEVLVHAHERGVVHRDLKPANILIDPEGHAHLTDFAVGKSLESLQLQTLAVSLAGTDTGSDERGGRTALGTWEYMAPEQKEEALVDAQDGESRVGARADIYAVGIVFHEMLTGKRPAGRVGLERFSPAIDAIFARCYTSLENRYACAEDLVRDVRRARRGKAVRPAACGATPAAAAGPAPPAKPARRKSSLSHVLAFLAFPVIVLAVVALTFHFRRNTEEVAAGQPSTAPTVGEAAAARTYRVRLVRFQLDRRSYENRVHVSMEPGEPDVYLRVYRERDGKNELVFDGSGSPVESWGGPFAPPAGELPAFSLSWKRGEAIRVEIWESDTFSDNLIARKESRGALAILLVSTRQVFPEGHVVEMESDFDLER